MRVKIIFLFVGPLLIVAPFVSITLKKINKSASAFRDKTTNKTTDDNVKIEEETPVATANV